MATAKLETKCLYVLELDKAEAGTLLDLASRVGGKTDSGPRARIDSIREALYQAGAIRTDHNTRDRKDEVFYTEDNS